MENESVNKDVCGKICQINDERFSRDKDDIKELKEQQHELSENQVRIEQLSIRMGEIINNDHDKLDDHEDRITAIEKRPSTFWDKLIFALIGAAASFVASGVLNEIFK